MKPKKPAVPDLRIVEMQQRQSAAGAQLAELQAQIELALQTHNANNDTRTPSTTSNRRPKSR